MKTLRKTIRKILLENTQNIEKIVELIFTGDIANINQAVELAQTMGYIEGVNYTGAKESEYFPEIVHKWTFAANKDFMYVVLEQDDDLFFREGFTFRSDNFRDVTVSVRIKIKR